MKLEDIKKDAQIRGLEGDKIVRIVYAELVGSEAASVFYVDQEGKPGTQSLFRSDESRLELAQEGRPWGFDAPGQAFKLGLEAYRIHLAHLFDPMMADVDPLPHQISAVYESMLPRQPLRFVLADDPGAGKTIMAGLFIRELIMRADAKRILIVSPGSLTEQWQYELLEKFGLTFEILSREKQEQCPSGNYFEAQHQLIARLDQLSRNEDFQEKLQHTEWDLIVVDEAHKMSAHYFGSKINETGRFKLGKLLGSITRHFLLMTATPHNGKRKISNFSYPCLMVTVFTANSAKVSIKSILATSCGAWSKKTCLNLMVRPYFLNAGLTPPITNCPLKKMPFILK
jgi:SNF2 family DNA or RNA helicase